MDDKMFWERFNKLAEKVKDGSGSAVYTSNRTKSVTLIKIKKSKRESEVGCYAIGNCSYYEEYDIIGEYVLKQNETLPSFFDVIENSPEKLIKVLEMRANYNFQRSIKAFRKHLTLKNMMAWLEQVEKA